MIRIQLLDCPLLLAYKHSHTMKEGCRDYAAPDLDVVFVNATRSVGGEEDNTSNTSHTDNDPHEAAMKAFLEFLYLMDAATIVRSTRSSFSDTIIKTKGLVCTAVPGDTGGTVLEVGRVYRKRVWLL